MPEPDRSGEQVIRETAYFIWEREGRPDGRAYEHWMRALDSDPPLREQVYESLEDEDKILAGQPDVNLPALLTKDVQGG